jgi:DNA-binding PadR family transcriptional regulator
MAVDTRPSPLGVAVLGLLCAGPLHPYRMQRLLKEWGKDQVINVGQRSSLYKTIKRLSDSGLIAVRQTERDQAYPERTVYELTPAGRRQVLEWIDGMLSLPRNEFPQFPAALSFAMLLGPQGALAALDRRAAWLREALDVIDAELKQIAPVVPRVALLETEYQRAVTAAELFWVTQLVNDLRSGTLSWSESDFAGLDDEDLPDPIPTR